MNLSEESPRWIWMNESAEAGNEARKYLARFPYHVSWEHLTSKDERIGRAGNEARKDRDL